jgi:hypothetical protein
VKARRRELVDELRFAHLEAARLSESLVALKAERTADPTDLFVTGQAWRLASDRATQLRDELLSITRSSEEEE